MTDKIKSWIEVYWPIITAAVIVTINITFAVAENSNQPSRKEMADYTWQAINKNNENLKQNYIEINKVPGLQERLKTIDDNIQEIKERFDKMESKIYKIK